jgi:hypothetical protein
VAKLYYRKTPLTAADLLNDRVVSFYDEHDVALPRVLTDRGRNTSSTLLSRTWITAAPKPKALKPMASSSAATELSSTSSIALHSNARFTARSKKLQVNLDSWIAGYNDERPIRDAGASARHRCELSLTPSP